MRAMRTWSIGSLLILTLACRGDEGNSISGDENACNTLLYVIPCIVLGGIGSALGDAFGASALPSGTAAPIDGTGLPGSTDYPVGTEVVVSGTAFVSPTDWRCCPADPGVTVSWVNRATGETGVADSLVVGAGPGVPPDEWRHEWRVQVRIGPGSNPVWFTAHDRSGNQESISITLTGR